jgi:hypothetical protein
MKSFPIFPDLNPVAREVAGEEAVGAGDIVVENLCMGGSKWVQRFSMILKLKKT